MTNNTNNTNNTNADIWSSVRTRQETYTGYLAYVEFMEGKSTLSATVETLQPLFAHFGIVLTIDNAANILTAAMASVGTDKGERARKVKSIATFRALLKKGADKGGWSEVASLPVHYSAGKAPASKSANSTKPTKAALEAEVEALKAQLAALLANQQPNA